MGPFAGAQNVAGRHVDIFAIGGEFWLVIGVPQQ